MDEYQHLINSKIKDEEASRFDSSAMLEENLYSHLGSIVGNVSNISPTKVKSHSTPEINVTEEEGFTNINDKISIEYTMTVLYTVRDNMIDIFSSIPEDKQQVMVFNINSIGMLIQKMGGEVDRFDPVEHISGLGDPDDLETMERVIATTKRCYKLGSVDAKILDEKENSIVVEFRGDKNGVPFAVAGKITPSKEGWTGNEAIDFVPLSNNQGRLSVKSYSNKKWLDKSQIFKIQLKRLEGQPVHEQNSVSKIGKSTIISKKTNINPPKNETVSNDNQEKEIISHSLKKPQEQPQAKEIIEVSAENMVPEEVEHEISFDSVNKEVSPEFIDEEIIYEDDESESELEDKEEDKTESESENKEINKSNSLNLNKGKDNIVLEEKNKSTMSKFLDEDADIEDLLDFEMTDET